MHATEDKNVFFSYNGDYSGDIYIHGKDRNGNESEVIVELSDLKGFLLGVLRSEAISTLENANSVELMRMVGKLGVTFPGTG